MEKYEIEPGIILVDKPSGISSFDVIRILRKTVGKELGIWKMGHAGTLDPRASGLMIIALGSATKKLSEYLKLPKEYKAEILFGVKTDTGDLDGKVIEQMGEGEMPKLSVEDVTTALSELIGEPELAVPVYSAIKRAGKPLYEYARAGQTVDKVVKKMGVSCAELVDFVFPKIKVKFAVASGTYIRSLAEELGRKLKVPATLAGLRRTSIAGWKVENAMKIENMREV
ncbi:MAG: tRNA pseudouridine(55) synthase TruB [bacterium]